MTSEAAERIKDMRNRVLNGEEITRDEYITAIALYRETRQQKAVAAAAKKPKEAKTIKPGMDLKELFK